jgi:GDP-L-fucose synthase
MAPQPIREEYFLSGPLEPTNEPYAVAKIAGIELCNSFNRRFAIHYLSVMPNKLYGPNDNYDLQNYHVLPALIRKFHLAKLAMQGNWEGIRKDEAIYSPIPEDVRISLGITNAIE